MCFTLQAWENVRGGSLEQSAADNMLKYAAEITDSDVLNLPAFERLVCHFGVGARHQHS
jgi:hypothetical protein